MEGKEGDGSERAGISPPAEVRKTRWSIPMSLRAALSPGGRAFGYQAPLCGTSWQFGFRKFKIRLETFLFDIVIAYSWGWLRYTSWGVWFCFRVWLLFLLNWEVIVGFLCGNCPKITQIVCWKHKESAVTWNKPVSGSVLCKNGSGSVWTCLWAFVYSSGLQHIAEAAS